jgi:uncharacterized protein YndB with AHSA1/START domain
MYWLLLIFGAMDIDVDQLIGATRREVTSGERGGHPVRAVRATRTFDTTVEDLWSAVTDPARLPRWFLPVTGDLRLGGRFQIEGNAGGEVLACDEPHRLEITWEMGEQVSWVEVLLSPVEGGAQLVLTHTAPVDPHWTEFGPGAVGIGWDLALMGLVLHVDTGEAVDPAEVAAWQATPSALDLMTRASDDWCRADIADGTAAEDAEARAGRTLAAYTGG